MPTTPSSPLLVRARAFVAAFGAAFALAACGDPAPPLKREFPREALTQSKSFQVRYAPIPDPIPLNRHFALEVTVQRMDGTLGDDLTINVDADMPEHKHGMNTKPRLTALGAGRFQVDGMKFHMPGYWEIYVDISTPNGPDRAMFPFDLPR